ncbi:uncharacterized protein LOC142321323 [Lycorma delicatula]|uniref:uncharacterized protein LOC142321323 n=1 Tax=Lycorma delicatula TaxID=130591 RepID=UPI003F510990
MTENRLVGLCMISVHKKSVLEAKNKFEKEILSGLTQNSHRSTAFINVLLSQPISHLDESVQQEILLFIEQARDTKQDVTAYGFFTVNNKTIIGLIGLITTYFIFWEQGLIV